MSDLPRLVVVGGGNMGAALVGGLVDGGWDPRSICVVEIDPAKCESLSASLGVAVSTDIVAAEGAVVAVKPADVAGVSAALAALGTRRIVSIAAGVTLAALETAAPSARIVRAMPNTPALVGEGVTAISAGSVCDEDDMAWAESVLSAVGMVVRVPESQMDAVTAVAGSGPGYLFLFAEALLATAIDEGLPSDVADALVRQLFKGAGALLADSTESPAVLRERVTSPNGTTAAGLAQFEAAGLRDIVANAVRAAAARSREMGR
ncbi:MAG: pyrroline-5-carboxylate reductase [Actinomycetota bacterium]